MLNEIREKLTELQRKEDVPMEDVAYGLLPKDSTKKWNYFVFNRVNVKSAGKTKGDFNEYYAVHVIHEDFIPEGYIYKVVQKLLEIKGIKLAISDDIYFSYAKKGNTDVVVEIATIVFTKAIFRGDVIGKSRN